MTEKIIIEVKSNLKEVDNTAQSIRDAMKEAATSATSMSNRAKGAYAAARYGQEKSQEYGVSRSIGIGTGAASRDFAKQAQGLGGLVHLYATFAANIFAVSAAYNALQRASDTTNLVKGLDQLGAASGRALGQLSKDIVKVTDNAVSLREAMTATAQASAAGMSNKDILRMAEGAKKASQALGVDMADALSRISRGITKLEPELLDEIGIFVRVDRAAQEYARKIGKPVSALTDLEKRAAFANAALSQVEAKFGEINIPTNPYTQLLASLKNISHTGLETVNSVLGPLVGLLAKSPTALAGVLGLITTKLVSQAIPAITTYRQHLREVAEYDLEKVTARARLAKVGASSMIRARKSSALTDADLRAESRVDEAEAQIGKLQKISKLSKTTKELLAGQDIFIRQEEGAKRLLVHLDEMAKKPTKIAAEYSRVADAIRQVHRAHEQYDLARIDRDKKLTKISPLSAAGVQQQLAKSAQASYERTSFISKATDRAEVFGFLPAVAKLYKDIDKSSSMTTLQKGITGVAGTAAAAATRLAGLGSALMGVFGWVGAIVGIGGMLLSFFSNNSAEAAKLEGSLGRVATAGDALEAVTKRLARLKDVDILFSVDTVKAKATAIETLRDSITSAVDDLSATTAARSTTDKVTNWMADWFGKSDEKEVAKAIGISIAKALNLASKDSKLFSAYGELTKFQGKKTYTKDEQQEIVSILGRSDAYKKYSDALVHATGLTETLTKSTRDLNNSYKDQSPLGKQIDSITQLSTEFTKLSQSSDPATLLATGNALETLAATGLFSSSEQTAIGRLVQDIRSVDLTKLEDLKVKLKENQDLLAKRGKEQGGVQEYLINYYSGEIKKLEATLQVSANKGQTFFSEGFTRAAAVLGKQLDQEFAKARSITATAELGYLPKGSAASIDASTRLKVSEIRSIEESAKALDPFTLAIYQARDAINKFSIEALRQAGKVEEADTAQALQDSISKAMKSANPVSALSKLASGSDNPAQFSQYFEEAQVRAKISARRAVSAAQARAAQTSGEIAKEELLSAQVAERESKARESLLEADKDRLAVLKALGALTDSEALTQEGLLTMKEKEARYLREIALLNAEEERAKKFTGKEQEQALAELARKRSDLNRSYGAITSGRSLEGFIVGDLDRARIVVAEIAESTKRMRLDRESEHIAVTQALQAEEGRLNIQIQTLELQQQEGRLTVDQYNSSKSMLELKKIQLAYEQDILSARKALEDSTENDLALLRQLNQEGLGDSSTAKEAERRVQQAYEGFESSVQKAKDVKSAADIAASGIASMSDQARLFGKWGRDALGTFSDALIDATQTGKFEFKDMINSMLLDLAKLEAKRAAMAIYDSTIGASGGLGGLLGSLFGGSSAAASSAAPVSDVASVMFAANGAAFDSNKILSSPTTFKFADGIGVAGEAGPEAIMPLKRDASGTLGVRAAGGSGNTSVVINNFSSEKAEAKETTDSRGNRRIEVTIGEIVASELSRMGSNAQQSMKSTFGAQPGLVRR